MRATWLGWVVVGLLLIAPAARAASVTVNYEATARTVVGTPFGFDVPLNTPVTGYFTFDTATGDEEPDPDEGRYRHNGSSAFVAVFLEHEVTGSSAAVYSFHLFDDYFRISDGPGLFGDGGGIMSVDGSPDEEIEMRFSASPGELADDSFFNPFPFFDFESFIATPHTFVIEDAQGTMLLQIDRAETAGSTTTTTLPANECGDPTGGGITAGDALFALFAAVGTGICSPCACDVDGSGLVAASDALTLLKVATGQQLPLNCPPC